MLCWNIQVVDKTFQPHECCAIASSTLLFVCFVSVKCSCSLRRQTYNLMLLLINLSNQCTIACLYNINSLHAGYAHINHC